MLCSDSLWPNRLLWWVMRKCLIFRSFGVVIRDRRKIWNRSKQQSIEDCQAYVQRKYEFQNGYLAQEKRPLIHAHLARMCAATIFWFIKYFYEELSSHLTFASITELYSACFDPKILVWWLSFGNNTRYFTERGVDAVWLRITRDIFLQGGHSWCSFLRWI